MLSQANSLRLPLRDGSVHCIFSSPPYFGLRLYDGLEPQIWGGLEGCLHQWGESAIRIVGRSDGGRDIGGRGGNYQDGGPHQVKAETGQFCGLCGAWRGHLGNEGSPEAYIAHMVEVGREAWRVLRDDGVFFLNLGDSYANGTKWGGRSGNKNYTSDVASYQGQRVKRQSNLPPKSQILIPHRAALALQVDGWIVRQTIPWLKMNSLPESVDDRPTLAHEYVFMLVKSEDYYWDTEATKRAAVVGYNGSSFTNGKTLEARQILAAVGKKERGNQDGTDGRRYRTTDAWLDSLDEAITSLRAHLIRLESIRDAGGLLEDGSGPLAVYTSLKGYSGAHFATFPVALALDLLRGATSEAGCCPYCGAGWERIIEKDTRAPGPDEYGNMGANGSKWAATQEYQSSGFRIQKNINALRAMGRDHDNPFSRVKTIGWRPTCDCPTHQPVSAIVADVFCGSGTVGEVCRKIGRRFVGVDLSAEYLAKYTAPRAEGLTTEAALEDARRARRPADKSQAKLIKAGQMSFEG